MKTTYTLGTPRSTETMATTMLSLDKQSRDEVASISYGENTFRFTTTSTLTPFMKDRNSGDSQVHPKSAANPRP